MENKTLIKPATLLKEDFIHNLASICNDCGLPFFVIECILKDFIQEIHLAGKKQLESDRIRYNQELLKLNNASNDDNSKENKSGIE